ncbi:MAG: response regulator [Myxococcaceae bacterium]|nr:response regulator [Myxococcaceae bacterium]MCI0670789.1 response regulator [Myxococcaceae bacterium]
MPKTILIVESDTALSLTLRTELEQRGFTVEETADGKGSVELIRATRPDLVVMAVDLSAGQNGYILCGKLKKDDELKSVPIVIMGNPDGFAQHSKLKTRADSYVSKPVEPEDLITAVGALIGMPEAPGANPLGDPFAAPAAVAEDDAEEIAVDSELESLDGAFTDIREPVQTDGALDVGSALDTEPPFEGSTDDEELAAVEPADGGGDAVSALDSDEPLTGLDALPGLEDEPLSEPADVAPVVKPAPRPAVPAPPVPTPRAAPPPPSGPPSGAFPRVAAATDAGELRALRSQLAELQAALRDAESRLADKDARVFELESELEQRSAELETLRSTGGKADKEFFALREAGNRKDKEVLRLKSELNEREQELVNLREREVQLEQQTTENAAEIARLKTLASRADQLGAERRKVEQQALQAREEARSAAARASTLEAEHASLQDELRHQQTELEALRAQLDEARQESESLGAASEQARADRATLEAELAELRGAAHRSDERVARLYARIKSDESLRDRTRKALAIAQQLLDEAPAAVTPDEAVA